MKIEDFSLTSWLEISSSALRHNYAVLKENLSPRTKTLCILKGNAYGHDLNIILSVLKKLRPDFYGVFNIQDGITVRMSDKKTPVLVLYPSGPYLVSIAL